MNLSTFSFKLIRFFKRIVIQLKYKHTPFTILSNNCIGGFLYDYFGLQFTSPIINCQMSPADFILFCENLNMYIHEPLIEVINPDVTDFRKLGGKTIDFPVGKIKDITVYFQHYSTFESAAYKWDIRKKRIRQNIFLVLVDTGGTQEIYDNFARLPYRKKIFLTGNKDIAGQDVFYMKTEGQTDVFWFDEMKNKRKKYYEQFNFFRWFMQK